MPSPLRCLMLLHHKYKTGTLKKAFYTALFTVSALPVFAQSKALLDSLSATPKIIKHFNLDYKINLPRPDTRYWDEDFNIYYKYLSPALRKTQMSLQSVDKGVIMVNPNSILPHAQLDTLTAVTNPANIQGTWRMVTCRNLRFTDSLSYAERKMFRSDTLLSDSSADDVFAFFEGNNFKLWVREKGKQKFKKEIASRFQLEQNRYLLLYKYFKSGSGVSQVGIDESGNLILNYSSVIENKKPDEYMTYITVAQQFIFEKVQ
jgi:hypothetical protein